MTSLPLALSLTNSFTQIGAIAGLAAIVGVAILSLLVFSQTRELKRLREWAGRAPERAADHEQRVSSAAAARVQQQVPASQPAQPAARPVPTPARAAAVAAAAQRAGAASTPSPSTLPAGQALTAAGTPAGQAPARAVPLPGSPQAPGQPGQPAPGAQPTRAQPAAPPAPEIGRASCRERV